MVWAYLVTQAWTPLPGPSNARILVKCFFALRWLRMFPSPVQLILQIVHHHLESLISTNRLFIRFSSFFASCILFSGGVLLLTVHFSALLSGKLAFFPTEAGETLLFDDWFLEFSSSQAFLCLFPWRCELRSIWFLSVNWHTTQVTSIPVVAVVTLNFFPSETGGTSLFGIWFLTFSRSQAALCRFPWRCELRTVSLWTVIWHIAQVHTFRTFSGGSISQRSLPPSVVVTVFMNSRGGNVLFSVWLMLDSTCLTCKCGKYRCLEDVKKNAHGKYTMFTRTLTNKKPIKKGKISNHRGEGNLWYPEREFLKILSNNTSSKEVLDCLDWSTNIIYFNFCYIHLLLLGRIGGQYLF